MSDNTLDILEMLTGDSAFLRHNWHVYSTAAVAHIDVTGSANITLTEIQAAHYQLRLYGEIAANINVYVPQKEKPYIFINATTGNFLVTIRPVTSGTGLPAPRGMLAPFNCDGTNVIRYGPGNARVPEGLFHTIESDGVVNRHVHDTYLTGETGQQYRARHARGTQLAPVRLVDEDRAMAIAADGWGRNAADTADEWVPLGFIRSGVDSVDAQGRLGGWVEILTSAGVSAVATARFRINEAGELVLGNPVTSNDIIRLRTEDREGVAGKHSLTIIAEDGTEHLFGDRARLVKQANGQSLDFRVLTEVTTIAAAPFTDTAIQIPQYAVSLGVSVLVLTDIPTATTFAYGIAGATSRHGAGISTAAETAYPGTDDGNRPYATQSSIRFTPNVTPATNAGTIRTTIHFYSIIPPTS